MLDLVADGDEAARRLVREAGHAIGQVLAGVCNHLNPARIVVGGAMSEAEAPLLAGIRAGIEEDALPGTHRAPRDRPRAARCARDAARRSRPGRARHRPPAVGRPRRRRPALIALSAVRNAEVARRGTTSSRPWEETLGRLGMVQIGGYGGVVRHWHDFSVPRDSLLHVFGHSARTFALT